MPRVRGQAAIEKKNRVLQALQIEYVPITEVRPNQYNPNRQSEHEFELLLRSMREDGITQPIIVQAETGEIVDGEHRWRAARTLGFDTIPVVRVEMTPEQMRIATLRHNRARGSEDIDLTARVLADLRELGALDWAQDSLMLDDVEVSRLLDDLPAPEALAGESFSDAWEPSVGDEAREAEQGGRRGVDMTPEAADRIREAERRVQEAKTEEERAAARRDTDVYRLSVVFAGEQGRIVQAVLGSTPAARILAICEEMVETGSARRPEA